MAYYSPRNNKSRKKNKRKGQRGIGAEANDLCAPAWASVLIGGLAAYGLIKAVSR